MTLPVTWVLLKVAGKVEGFVRAGRASVAIDVIGSGRTASRNGLREALVLVKGYPVVLETRRG